METKLSLLCLLLTVIQVTAFDGQAEDRLSQHLLMNNIARHIRPVKDSKTTLRVNVGLALIRFESLDETNGALHLNTWMRYENKINNLINVVDKTTSLKKADFRETSHFVHHLWHDDYLKWDPSDFNGTDQIRLPAENIWNPDIVVFNRISDSDVSNVLTVVSSDGTVLYIPVVRTHTHCSLDFTYFPYDTQTCIIKLGSWTYDGFKMDIDFYDGLEQIDMTDYIHNHEWEVLSTGAAKNAKYYPCCEEPYPDLTFNLTMRRKTSYYTYVYLGPAVVLSLLAPFIFLLPPGDQQKITLGVGLLVCFTLFFLEMSTTLPTIHAHTPLVDKYYMTMYVLLCMAMALSTLVSNLARRTITLRHPPEIVKKVLLSCLGRCLCISYTMYSDLPPAEEDAPDVKVAGTGQAMMQHQPSSGSDIKEWLLIATVVDRLLFLVYLVLSVVLTIVILTCRG